jgi:hypothetical protein
VACYRKDQDLGASLHGLLIRKDCVKEITQNPFLSLIRAARKNSKSDLLFFKSVSYIVISVPFLVNRDYNIRYLYYYVLFLTKYSDADKTAIVRGINPICIIKLRCRTIFQIVREILL